ncbi:MAG: L,D-transpeptidase family protein [Chitinophagaceae bacterium]|nr:L,D-transpeptidase family protein [Chitinophagaceae bacterium]
MKRTVQLYSLVFSFALLTWGNCFAQNSFVQTTKFYTNSGVSNNRLEDSLKKEFENKNLSWPPQSVYIRSFKYDRILEIWVKKNDADSFSLFKSYNVCMQSGGIGPKRSEGDNQVPEGFYYINEFNAKSNYHLALGLNYPNSSDKVLSDSKKPGGEIYIHGSCVSTGCIAIQDMPIEEVYLIASKATAGGQDFIPVHIFPVKYSVQKSLDYLTRSIKGNQANHKYTLNIKAVFDYFEKNKQLPIIMVNKNGDYLIN